MGDEWQPRIVAFFCNWCTYTAADLAGVSRMKYAANVRVIRVMCSGRVDPQFVLKAFESGADGVLIGGCHPGDCHYMEGNYKCLRRYHLLERMLQDLGVAPERFRLEWISASEGNKVKSVIDSMVETLTNMGPLAMPTRMQGWDSEVDHALTELETEVQKSSEEKVEPETTAAGKPKVAFYWCASCGGCEESVVDLAEDILDVVSKVDIVFWPVAMDFKKSDVEKMKDKELTVSFINGAVRTSEQEEMAYLLRRKSQVVIAYGSCAHSGGIPALSNLFSREKLLKTVYEDAPSVVNPEATAPSEVTEFQGQEVRLPGIRSLVRSLDQVVDVDYYLPGCAPSPTLLKAAIETLLSGELPPKGSVLAPDHALCQDCPRKESKPEDLSFNEFKRVHQVDLDPETCFLSQGIFCMGPATRSGCEAVCLDGNMPCSGCYGPTSRVTDQGAKILSSIASNLDSNDPEKIKEILNGIPDPTGTFYRYGMAKCSLRARVDAHDNLDKGKNS